MKIIEQWLGVPFTTYAYLRDDPCPRYDTNQAPRLNNTHYWSVPSNYAYLNKP